MDATKRKGASTMQKMCSALRVLGYGVTGDIFDEYLRISYNVILNNTKEFCRAMITLFSAEFLRVPNSHDIVHLYKFNRERGFPGLIGSLNCMHWEWKNCPKAYSGQYSGGRKKKPTMILEVVASHDLWIWHSFFGLPGANNDINVIDRSPLLDSFMCSASVFNNIRYELNGKYRFRGYFLTDGIYPDYGVFVKPISNPINEKEKYFTKIQESAQKDVERAFGVLQSRFHILAKPCKLWFLQDIECIVKTCIILHNMILKEKGVAISTFQEESCNQENFYTLPSLTEIITNYGNVSATCEHKILMQDIQSHVWKFSKKTPKKAVETCRD